MKTLLKYAVLAALFVTNSDVKICTTSKSSFGSPSKSSPSKPSPSVSKPSPKPFFSTAKPSSFMAPTPKHTPAPTPVAKPVVAAAPSAFVKPAAAQATPQAQAQKPQAVQPVSQPAARAATPSPVDAKLAKNTAVTGKTYQSKDQAEAAYKAKVAAQKDLDVLNANHGLQTKNLELQKTNLDELAETLDEAKRDLETMRTQEMITKSTEAIVSVNHDGVMSASSRFKRFKEMQNDKLTKAQVRLEVEHAPHSLDEKVEAALHSKDQRGEGFLGESLINTGASLSVRPFL